MLGSYWWRLWLVLLGLALWGGCGFLGYTTERDEAGHYLWTKRGKAMGDLVHLLCTQASARERSAFMTALGDSSGHQRVTILCDSNGP